MKNSSKKKKIIKYSFLAFVILCAIFTSFFFAKYKKDTPHKVIQLFTKYNVNYQTNNGKFNNPEKFNSYFSITGLTLPVEGDITKVGHDFAGWYLDNNFTGDAVTEIKSGEVGDKLFFAAWHTAEYDLKVQTKDANGNIVVGLPADYTIVIGKDINGNDNVVQPDSSGIIKKIGKYQQVSIRMPYSEEASSSGLSFNDESISLNMRYTDGEQYIYFDFKMPRKDLTLTYDVAEDTSSYIDISKSSIIFEKNVSIEGTPLTKNGFWYKSTISGMAYLAKDEKKGYFYEWDYAKPFYVTSKNKETQNQLILVDAMSVYFKDCKLVPRDEYKTDFIGRKFKNYQLDIYSISQLLGKADMADLSSYGNVVIKSTNDNVIKGLKFYIDGENTIGTIMQAYLRNSNNDVVNIEGVNDGVLNLGLLFYSACTFKIDNITINEYENDFDYIIMSWVANMSFSGTTLNASSKNIYVPNTMPSFGKYNKQRDSIIKLNNLRANYMINLNDKTYMHIYNDLYTASGFQVSGNSSLLVDGNAFLGYGGAYHTGINTTGYVLIKGSISGSDLVLQKGTFIANTVGNSRGGGNDMNISGGTLITNLYSSVLLPAANLNAVNTDTTSTSLYALNIKNNMTTANSDNLPFIMGEPTNTNAASVRNKTFSGGKVYVLGDYQIKEVGNDQIVDRTYHGKKVQEIINSLLGDSTNNEHPDIKDSILSGMETSEKLNSDYLKQIVRESKTDKTSFVIGRSDIDWSINFKGTELYVAGNMDLRFKTNITAGKIVCYGSISSKHDLVIDGSNVEIEADEIGNQLALTKTTANNLTRYSTLSLKNGSLKVNRIGAISQMVNAIPNRSTVILSGNANIESQTGNSVTFVQDEYVNYLLSDMVNSVQNPTNVRYLGTVDLSAATLVNYSDITWNLLDSDNNLASQDLSLVNPVNDSGDGKWVLGSEKGQVVTKFATDGLITNTEYAPYQEEIALYAVKTKYGLQIKEGSNFISSITYPTGIENNELQYTTANNIANNDEYDVYALGSQTEVTLELTDASMKDKIIIWYYDGAGVLHNTMPETQSNGTTISFDMPMATTEIYITNEITLFLDKYEIVLTDYGFRTTWNAPSGQENVLFDDTCFKYLGSVAIRQSQIKIDDSDTLETAIYHISESTGKVLTSSGGNAPLSDYVTSNRIRFAGNFDNISDSSRNVTIYPIYQKIVSDTNYCGIELLAGAQVHIYISGAVRTEFIENPTNSYLFMEGKGQAISHKYSTGTTTTTMFGSKKGGTGGDYKFKNLTYHQTLPAIGIAGGNSLVFDNCLLKIDTTYAIASSINVKIINSTVSASYNLFQGTQTLDIKDSNVTVLRNRYPIFYGIKKSVVLEGNTTVNEEIHPTPTYVGTYSGAEKVIIKDNASLTAKDILVINGVEITNNGSLTVTGSGSLLLNSATVNGEGAMVTAGDIILSGYYPPTISVSQLGSLSEFNNIAANYDENTNMFASGGNLTLINGTVNVANQIGGNLDFAININGGNLTSKYIGTADDLYGVVLNSYSNGEVYKYPRVSTSENHFVNINGGTVNVLDNGYLGGMKAKVDITGGTINLGENAVIGMNEEDTTKLVNSITAKGDTPSELVDVNIKGGTITGSSGYINTPYSTLSVDSTSSNPSINIKDVLADYGTVNIKGASNHYDNPLGEGERVGVLVNNSLIAERIEIMDGAVVYAKKAIIKNNTPDVLSHLKVESASYLYSSIYGTDGIGNFTLDNNGTIVGTRQYSIKYNMADTFIDPATNPNDYNYVQGTQLQLTDPSRFGYIFKGWYDNNGNQVTEISQSDVGDKELTAHWEAKTVAFVVTTSAAEAGLSTDEFRNQVDLSLGQLNEAGDKFTYNEHLEISYHNLLNTKLLLSNYNLSSLFASGAKINNEVINPDGDILNLTSTGETVTKEMMEYYLNNNIPIEISVCEYVTPH